MVDVDQMRKKFPVKNETGRRRKNAAIKQIAHEYEMKKAEMNGLKAPAMKRGIVYYAVIGLGLLLLASLVMSATGKGTKAPKSKAKIQARKSLDAIAIAAGRYRYHIGEYPETLEDLASTKVAKAGWNGPYIKKVVKDPWGRDYAYFNNGTGKPTLYSKGADGVGGTQDDMLAEQSLFDEPFRDTSWTRDWVPYRFRGIVVAPDEETKHVVQNQVSNYLAATAVKIREETAGHQEFLAREVSDDDLEQAASVIAKRRANPLVEILSRWTYPESDEGTEVLVEAEVDGDEVELFVNNDSCGRVPKNDRGVCSWRVKYEPGEIKAIGFRGGHPIGEDAVRTAYEASEIRLHPMKNTLADNEIGYAAVEIVDDSLEAVPGSSHVEFTLSGPGRIMRTNGYIVAFRRNGTSGESLVLRASKPGLRPAVLEIPWRVAE